VLGSNQGCYMGVPEGGGRITRPSAIGERGGDVFLKEIFLLSEGKGKAKRGQLAS